MVVFVCLSSSKKRSDQSQRKKQGTTLVFLLIVFASGTHSGWSERDIKSYRLLHIYVHTHAGNEEHKQQEIGERNTRCTSEAWSV
jgi:hypothetical protein